MRTEIASIVAILSLALSASAQPVIRAGSVVNAANNLPAGLPNAGLAQGSTFVLKGQNLGAKGTVVASSFPLSATMGGTSMKITVGGATVNVLMVYVVGGLSDYQGPFDQLAGIVPSNTPTGSGSLTVTYNNQTSASVPVTILANAFGTFTINQQGSGPGVFTDTNYRVNTLVNSAHAGEQWFIWGSGLGAIGGNDADMPPVVNLNVPVQVYVGGVQANIGYQGRSGCCSGIDQILIKIPAGVTGCYVPVAVIAAGVVSNFTTMSIAESGSICSDPLSYGVADLQKAQSNTAYTVANLSLFRISANVSTPSGAVQGVSDQGSAYFQKYNSASGILAALPVSPLPSTGCIVYTRPSEGTNLFDNFTLSPQHDFIGLDGGAFLNLSGPQGAQKLTRKDTGSAGAPDFRYKADLGGDPPLDTAGPAYLLPGSYTMSGTGGADVGGFSAQLTVPSISNPWANENALVTLPRNQDLTISLNPSASGIGFGILGNSTNSSIGQIGIFSCVIPPGAASFTIPSYVLSALPASGLSSDLGGVPTAFLGVAVGLANPTKVQAQGVDAGAFSWFDLFVKNVNFQ